MTTDINNYVKFLVEKGNYTNENAISIINKLKAKIAELMPNDSDEAREQILNLKIRDLVMASSAEKYDAIIVAMDAVKDGNGYNRYLAVQAFKADPARAIADGIVMKADDYLKQLISAGKNPVDAKKIVDELTSEGGIIALDTTRYFDQAQTKKNNNFGKPLPLRMQREAYAIINNNLVRVFAHADAPLKCGYAFTLYGSMSKNGNLSLAKTPAAKEIEALDDHKLWDAMYNAALNSDKLAELYNLHAVKKNHIAIVKGYILNNTVTSRGDPMLFIGDEACEQGIACFPSCPEIAKDMESFGKGSEVIAIGRVSKNTGPDGVERSALILLGIIASPLSAKLMDISSQLDEILVE